MVVGIELGWRKLKRGWVVCIHRHKASRTCAQVFLQRRRSANLCAIIRGGLYCRSSIWCGGRMLVSENNPERTWERSADTPSSRRSYLSICPLMSAPQASNNGGSRLCVDRLATKENLRNTACNLPRKYASIQKPFAQTYHEDALG